MNPMMKRLLMDEKPIIPPSLKPNVLAWWDARKRGQVWYAFTQAQYDDGLLTDVFGAGKEPTASEWTAIKVADIGKPATWEGTRQVLCNPDNKYYWNDMSGNGNHIKLNNFAYSGASGWDTQYSLSSDGVNDWGNCGFINQNGVSSLTVGAMFIVPTLRGVDTPIMSCTENGGFSLSAPSDTDNTIGFIAHINGTYRFVKHSSVIPAGTKVFAVGSFDGRYSKLYVNGILSNIFDAGGIFSIKNAVNTPMAILANPSPTGTSFCTQTKIYMGFRLNRAITDSEVMQIYKNNRRRFGL